MESFANLGTSLIKELGLWVGVVLSILLGLLWCVPYVIVYGLGSGHTTDATEGALLICLGLAGISFLAAILFTAGAIKNTVSTGNDSASIPMIDAGGSDIESV